jgi:hypothetical protein
MPRTLVRIDADPAVCSRLGGGMTAGQRFCTNCGTPREANHKFCTGCGARFPVVSSPDPSALPAAETPTLPAEQETEDPTTVLPAVVALPPKVQPEAPPPIVPSVETASKGPPVDGHDLDGSTPTRSRTGLWVAVAVSVALALVAGVVFAMSRGTDQPTVSASPPSSELEQSTGATPSAVTSPSSQTTPTGGSADVSEYADVTSEKPPVAVVSFDPCEGGPFPFDDALSVSSQPPAAGSDVETAVSNVQRILNSLGYTGTSNTKTILVDGWYGEHTEYAVRNFQRDMDIEPVGTVYTQTWAALGQRC